MSERTTINSDKLIAEIEEEIKEKHYNPDVPRFSEVMAVNEHREFDSQYLHTAVESLHQNWKINPYLNVAGGGFKNKAKRLMCKLTKPIVEFTSEQNSRFNINTAEAMSRIEAYIDLHEKDTKIIEELQEKVDSLNDRVNELEKSSKLQNDVEKSR